MSIWPQYPTIYEINTWVWLSEVSLKTGKPVDLGSVPSYEWDAIAKFGFDAVWFMGVWERSPAGIAIANKNTNLLDDFRRALHDFTPEDNVGSPYCVKRYVVDKHLGGPEGLAIARRELAKRGIKLLLDFVPNHLAPDHPWVTEHPEYFIRGNIEDVRNNPASFIEIQGNVCACGRDPYFPAWPDVLQLNVFQPGLRQAVVETLSSVLIQCDGVRCDMAMLLLNQIFEQTWGSRAGQRPPNEYWDDVIAAVKRKHPDACFIAEAYWDLECELQQHGFDFCYDKRLYDRLKHENGESVRLHLCADLAYQRKLLRFLENHDEPRAAAVFSLAKEQATAVTTSTLPGARLFHEGQFEGRRVRLPVFLGRRPAEPVNNALQIFYDKLLAAINAPIFRGGEWQLCERNGWPDNQSYQNLVAWSWIKDDDRRLIAVNLSDSAVQARVQVPWDAVRGKSWHLIDALSDAKYDRDGNEMASSGLYIELQSWSYCFFQYRPAGQGMR
ncbi:MAG TPA: alpha-amylase family glycosyl hydrolase [Terriglobales bacterium]|nr:alpha-amylase family glycosyl hydrolase [Terriglobales bacterium]